jgi:hypothetical protein
LRQNHFKHVAVHFFHYLKLESCLHRVGVRMDFEKLENLNEDSG